MKTPADRSYSVLLWCLVLAAAFVAHAQERTGMAASEDLLTPEELVLPGSPLEILHEADAALADIAAGTRDIEQLRAILHRWLIEEWAADQISRPSHSELLCFAGGEHAMLVADEWLRHPDPPMRRRGLSVLLWARVWNPSLQTPREEWTEMNVVLPLIERTTYDSDVSVRGGAVGAMGVVAERYLRSRMPMPQRLQEGLWRATADAESEVRYTAWVCLRRLGLANEIPPDLVEEFGEPSFL